MKNMHILVPLLVLLSAGCLTFDTHREGAKLFLGVSIDSEDVQTTLNTVVEKANAALKKAVPGGE